MFALNLCEARIVYGLTLVSPLHVGGGGDDILSREKKQEGSKARDQDYALKNADRNSEDKDSKVLLPVHYTDRSGGLHFYVPGPSLRGALRHYLALRLSLAQAGTRRTGPEYALEKLPSEYTAEEIEDLNVKNNETGYEHRTGHLLVRMLFGTEARAGQLAIGPADLVHDPTNLDTLTPRAADIRKARYSGKEYNDRTATPARNATLALLTQNRLDRATQGSAQGGLRTLAALEAGEVLYGEMHLRNVALWQLGLLYLAVDAANQGRLTLGGKTGVGLGRVKLEFVRLDLRWNKQVAPTTPTEILGIGKAAETLGLVKNGLPFPDSPFSTEQVRAFLGQRVAEKPDKTEERVQLFMLDPGDSVPLAYTPRALTEGDNPFERCFERTTIKDKAVITALLTQSTARLKTLFNLTLEKNAPEEKAS